MATVSPPSTLTDSALTLAIRTQLTADPNLDQLRVVGAWGNQVLRNLSLPHLLGLEMADASLGRLWFEGPTTKLHLQDLRIAGGAGTGLKILAKDNGTPCDLSFDNAQVNGTGMVRAMSVQRWVWADGVDRPTTWPTNIAFTDCSFWGSAGDITSVYGGRNIAFRRCLMRDPVISASTVDHIDLLQVTHCVPAGAGVVAGYEFPVGLLVEECRMGSSKLPAKWGGPHQGIILSGTSSTPGAGNINGVVLRGNQIGRNDRGGVCLPGTGIVIASPDTRNIRCYGNPITVAHGGCVVMADVGPNIVDYACPFVPHG